MGSDADDILYANNFFAAAATFEFLKFLLAAFLSLDCVGGVGPAR